MSESSNEYEGLTEDELGTLVEESKSRPGEDASTHAQRAALAGAQAKALAASRRKDKAEAEEAEAAAEAEKLAEQAKADADAAAAAAAAEAVGGGTTDATTPPIEGEKVGQ